MPVPDTSSPLDPKAIAPIMDAIAKDINQPIEKDLGQPIAQVTPPWARLVDQTPAPGPEAKLNVNQENTPTSIQKELSQTNVKDLSLTHPVASHRSDKAIKVRNKIASHNFRGRGPTPKLSNACLQNAMALVGAAVDCLVYLKKTNLTFANVIYSVY